MRRLGGDGGVSIMHAINPVSRGQHVHSCARAFRKKQSSRKQNRGVRRRPGAGCESFWTDPKSTHPTKPLLPPSLSRSRGAGHSSTNLVRHLQQTTGLGAMCPGTPCQQRRPQKVKLPGTMKLWLMGLAVGELVRGRWPGRWAVRAQ